MKFNKFNVYKVSKAKTLMEPFVKYTTTFNKKQNKKNISIYHVNNMSNTNGYAGQRTDYQKVAFTGFDITQYSSNKDIDVNIYESITDANGNHLDKYKNIENTKLTYKDFINKYKPTVQELYRLVVSDKGEDSETASYYKKLIESGYGDYHFLECVADSESGFDAFVLEDTEGNPIIYFCGTNADQQKDMLYDARNIIDDYKSSNCFRSFAINAAYFYAKPAAVYLDFTLEDVEKIYHAQQEQASDLFNKYLVSAKNKNKKVYLQAHSLSGSLAENAVLSASESSNADMEKHFGGLIEYNGYHDNLNNSDIEILKKQGIELYATQGDMISEIFNANELESCTKYLHVNWDGSSDIDGDGNPDEGLLKRAYDSTDSFKLCGIDWNKIINLWGSPLHSVGIFYEGQEKLAFDTNGTVIPSKRVTFKESTKIALGDSYSSVSDMLDTVVLNSVNISKNNMSITKILFPIVTAAAGIYNLAYSLNPTKTTLATKIVPPVVDDIKKKISETGTLVALFAPLAVDTAKEHVKKKALETGVNFVLWLIGIG